jgi:hypothetical protein
MTFTSSRAVTLALTAVLLATLPLAAQETGITGRVTDPSGAAVQNVAVTASGEDGSKVSTTTNTDGLYQVPALRGQSYVVRLEGTGFAPAERSLTLLVGTTANVDVQLQVATASAAVAVVANAVSIETTSSAVAGDVSPAEVSRLPLNGRNYMQLAALVPGITSNDVTNTPLGVTDNGKLQINVDGQQVTQNAAGDSFGEPQYSQDAIDQFQIITNRFDATLGRSSRIQINVQTKSGSNQFHGTLYGYFRNDVFNAADPVAHKVLPFSDQQFGGTFGGPILKDKLFFFFAYEGERQPNTIYDTPTGFSTTYTFANEIRTNSYLLHTDWLINTNNRLAFRATGYTWNEPFNISSTPGAGSSVSPSHAALSTRTSYAGLLTWSSTISPALVNEAKVGFNHFEWLNAPLVNSQQYDLPGGITVGGAYNYPQHFFQNSEQYRDDLFWLKGTHSFKTGVDFLHTKYSGIFQQNIRGQVLAFSSGVSALNYNQIFPVWNEPSTWDIAALSPYAESYVQGFGNFNIDIPTNNVGAWFQDDWKLSPRLTLNLGLRYDNDLGIFDPGLYLKSGIQTPHYNDNLLFQPRFGFAWDVTGSRRTVIRGGAGLFYADIQANQVIDQQIFNGQASLQPALQATPTTPINLLAPFGATTGAEFLSGAVPVNAQTIQPLGPNVQTPYSLQLSIGIEHQLSKTWTVSADYVHWRVYHDWERTDSNLYVDPATGYPANPKYGRPNPNFVAIESFTTPAAAGSINDGLQVQIEHRFSQRFSVSLAYTLARLKDSTTSPFYYPNNQDNLAAEWAISPDNQTNTLTLGGAYTLKWGIALSGSFHYGSGQNFQVTSNQNPFGLTGVTDRLFTAGSAYYGPAADVSASSVAGYDIVKRDFFVGNPIYLVNVRLSKTFTVKEHLRFIPIVEAFNLFNHANFGSYNTVVNLASFGTPVQNQDLAYAPRMLQFAGRIEF